MHLLYLKILDLSEAYDDGGNGMRYTNVHANKFEFRTTYE